MTTTDTADPAADSFTGPLTGVRVIDLSKILAGPYATMSLADLGAEVIKVEHPEGGDPTRAWGPPTLGADATYFHAANHGKKSVTIDLKSDHGQAQVYELLAGADVIVENFRPGSSLQQIFDYQELAARFPHLVVLHISAFGDDGPLRDEPGYDMVAQARGGLMSLTGEAEGPPMKAGFAMGDLGAGLFGIIGIVSALFERSRTGRGQYLTTSLYEGQLALHVNWATNYFADGNRPHALGSGHPNLVPYQAYPAADDYFVIAIGNDSLWQKLCTQIERPDLAVDDRLQENRGRVAHRELVEAELSRTLRTNTVENWCAKFSEAGVPAAPIKHLDEVYADPQTEALGMVQTVDHPSAGPMRQVAFPVNFNGVRPPVRSAPPELGADTDDILGVEDPPTPTPPGA
ncbi:CaiB/BaiF CoA transferase family protein [Brevibacterium marinum]|uniref:Crotonobetainyl-CoA:carnitine CoA-transferase CaiB-like acyl-CoA transferase n=1 Tax=Brevibacterium marinum TaxID=418643 RepID=A0A846S4R4_9MICO|nr:CoA transferase [Brevibacterium marinum]NJC58610.1 crotonobetainyl-CoA:carnitine CoA-transferase CaiB-like acyl-CoA transferase [Brevibacterium marinum]